MKIDIEGSVSIDADDDPAAQTLLGIFGNYVANQTTLRHGLLSAALNGKKPCSCQDEEEGESEPEPLGLKWTVPASGRLTGQGLYCYKIHGDGRFYFDQDPVNVAVYCWFKLPNEGDEIIL